MAVKQKDTEKKPAVTRISASDTEKPIKPAKSSAETGDKSPRTVRPGKNLVGLPARIFGAIGGYFVGAWRELRQVRWPNRRATWGMTGALLGFTAFFVVFILLIDALFEYIFKVLLG